MATLPKPIAMTTMHDSGSETQPDAGEHLSEDEDSYAQAHRTLKTVSLWLHPHRSTRRCHGSSG